MGYLLQSSSAIADTDKYSVSFWSRVNSANLTTGSAAVGLFQHGPRLADQAWASSAFTLGPIFSGCQIQPSGSTASIIISGQSAPNGATVINDDFGDTAAGTAYFWQNIGSSSFYGDTAVTYPLDTWVHIAYSVHIQTTTATFVDFAGPGGKARYNPTSYSLHNFVLNAVVASSRLGDDSVGTFYLPGDYIGWPTTNPTAAGMPKGAMRSGTTYWASDANYYTAAEGPTGPSINSSYPTPFSVGAYNLSFKNMAIGIPTADGIAPQNALFSARDGKSNPKVEYGDFQLWTGQYIDWTNASNFAKVVKVSGSKGTPENPSTAAAAFGKQTVLFSGKASDNSFYTNQGSGGTFTKTGTASDFTPTPSY